MAYFLSTKHTIFSRLWPHRSNIIKNHFRFHKIHSLHPAHYLVRALFDMLLGPVAKGPRSKHSCSIKTKANFSLLLIVMKQMYLPTKLGTSFRAQHEFYNWRDTLLIRRCALFRAGGQSWRGGGRSRLEEDWRKIGTKDSTLATIPIAANWRHCGWGRPKMDVRVVDRPTQLISISNFHFVRGWLD